MSHTIDLGPVRGCAKAIVVCNGDFSGKLSFRVWTTKYTEDKAPDLSVDLPDGLGPAFVKVFLYRKLVSAAESHLPRLLDLLDRV